MRIVYPEKTYVQVRELVGGEVFAKDGLVYMAVSRDTTSARCPAVLLGSGKLVEFNPHDSVEPVIAEVHMKGVDK